MFKMIRYYILFAVFFYGGFAFPSQKDGRPTLEDGEMTNFFDLPPMHMDSRLVGGSLAVAGSYPWMAVITTGFSVRIFICGGSIISNRHILTAAHCIDAIMASGDILNTRITTQTIIWNGSGAMHSARLLSKNPQYDPVTNKNDIGVIGTQHVILENWLARIVPITYDFIPGGVPARVSGWGWLSAAGSLSERLHELRLITFDGESCGPELTRVAQSVGIHLPKVDPKVELCTLLMANYGICIGDGGSPLVRDRDSHLIGVASWGLPCARGAPDMFARVSAFRDYIKQILDMPLPQKFSIV